jgi:hypothetical protein
MLVEHAREGAVVLRFPLERIRRVRPRDLPADRAPNGKVVLLATRSPLRLRAIEGGLPPAA